MKETLKLQLATNPTRVQIIGAFSNATIQFPQTAEELVTLCQQALQKYYETHGEYVLIVDFQDTTKITSIGFSVLEADVQEIVIQQKNQAKLKFINFPQSFKPSFETRAIYYRLSKEGGIEFRE